ncbi:acyclic terpene utilization AtuA family protein [Bosea sp. (in: a-proteobacteria)]|uniref:acyclic terpene utilization AtuA family protein n=1 Tax=Bosea sp. (in: a-proteobacteria) TaxID=1871050 RepID=UPI002DDD30C4|nr:acyclic terpene utilization AtuA family protein [Bosea sp. (in: a-proteobacteria)]HEV2512127.1 acyclic terpene utilization AtuA family protein [Bosea sp. (in: a-proteobacteria)]
MSKTIRIGCGAGFAGDRIEPAIELAERGRLDFLFFEGLAERTLAQSHLARLQNPALGYNPLLERRIASVLPACRANGTRIVTNMGAANPLGAGRAIAATARRLGISGIRIAVVEGDDVTSLLDPAMPSLETGESISATGRSMIGANAYLGADVVAAALDMGADIVVTGRVADPSLVVGPLMHGFGWAADDWQRLGAGTAVGHLLECSCQITGGYFADPGFKDVEDVAFVGYPFAEVEESGDAIITKPEGTGGCVTRHTVKEQLLYEVHDPAAYLTPDVTADFSQIALDQAGPDRVGVRGGRGRERPGSLKVTVGFDGGILAEAEISYAGPGASERARLAMEIVRLRMEKLHRCRDAIRFDIIGMSSLHASAISDSPPSRDVRLRAAMRTVDPELGRQLLAEVEALWIAGPAGGGGARGRLTPSIVTQSVLIDRTLVKPRIEMVET